MNRLFFSHRLRQELKGMRVQLAERTRAPDRTTSTSELDTKPEKDTNYTTSTFERATKPNKDTNTNEYTNEVQSGCVVM